MTPQLSLFQNDDQPVQPLPLQVASDYGFSLQYHVQGDDSIVYAVQDWIAGVAQTSNATRFWNDLKKRFQKSKIELYASCVQLPYRASNGKSYQMDFADDVTLYRILQRMDVDTGIRSKVMDFLAKAGAFVDELRQDSEAAQQKIANHRQAQAIKAGRPASWVNVREMGVMTRNELTALIIAVCPHMNIGEVTNITYEGTLGRNAKGLRTVLNIGPKQNPRDHMGEIALIYTMASEAAVRAQLVEYAGNDLIPADTVRSVIKVIAKATGKQAQETAALIGIDLVTGRKLLAQGGAR